MKPVLLALCFCILGAATAFAQDVCGPAKVTTLAAATYYASIRVTWNATGDDCSTGNASTYEVRYSTSSITDANWCNATVLSSGSSATNGNENCAVYTGSCPGTQSFYFAVALFDDAGNRSPLSNVVSGSTRCSPPYQVAVCDE